MTLIVAVGFGFPLVGVVLVATFLVQAVFYYLQNYSLAYSGERIVVDLRRQVYSHLHDLTLRFFNDRL